MMMMMMMSVTMIGVDCVGVISVCPRPDGDDVGDDDDDVGDDDTNG